MRVVTTYVWPGQCNPVRRTESVSHVFGSPAKQWKSEDGHKAQLPIGARSLAKAEPYSGVVLMKEPGWLDDHSRNSMPAQH